MAEMSKTARQIVFRGRVQGVGFRYTACRIAAQHGLTGWVRNCPDGSVESVMQGSAADIDRCIDAIKTQFGSFVRDITQSDMPHNPRYKDFQITY
jgi:acylphosphatase